MKELHAPSVEPHLKHLTIFKTFEELGEGEFFILINDHDPKPLRFQFYGEYGDNAFTWEYLETGPEKWKILIGKPVNS